MFNQVNFCVSVCVALCFSCCIHASRATSVDKAIGKHDTYRENKDTNSSKSAENSTIIFNVKDYGAKGDGVTDDSEAFEEAFTSACRVENGMMYIPANLTFLLQPIIFNGAMCKLNLTIQVDGKIVAPSNIKDWKNIGGPWILFNGFSNGLLIKGKGIFDGYGEDWWKNAELFLTYEQWMFRGDENTKKQRPQAIMISMSNNVVVTDITIQNSPQMHIFFGNCEKFTIFGITLSSPGNSPNTDGIHLSDTIQVDIQNSILACGDDCVSIQSGCHDVSITNVQCGPGHGYSIGSLGYKLQEAHVSNINISNSSVTNAVNGVRIKTWEGATGSLQNIIFENIMLNNIENDIIIDQYYCEHEFCNSTGSTNAVAISGVTFKNVTGTYTRRSVALVCSAVVPCKNIDMAIIDLTPLEGQGFIGINNTYCSNAYGKLLTTTIPSLVTCLKSDSVVAPSPSPTPSPIMAIEGYINF